MIKIDHHNLMCKAIDSARDTMNLNIGGPFGALVVDKYGIVLSVASNTVLEDHDPTAHAEINAIRAASKRIGSHDLTGCTLITTCYPCPMCLGAIMWSNIKKVYYGATAKDTRKIGFRDDFMYDFIKSDHKDVKVLDLENIERDSCLKLFEEYQETEKQLY